MKIFKIQNIATHHLTENVKTLELVLFKFNVCEDLFSMDVNPFVPS